MTERTSFSSSSPSENLKFAIPKKGRFFEKVSEILKGSGISYHRAPRLDVALCINLPITLVFLPAADIAKYVGEGDVDIGITGFDVVQESNVEVVKEMDLGFGACRLCVQAPAANKITDVSVLAGGRIVTSFPHLSEKFFKSFDDAKGVKTKITEVSGSVEAACGLGLADAVVDLVETGTTMKAAGLAVVADVLKTEAILISNPHTEHKGTIKLIKRRVEGFITSTKFVMISYNVHNDLLSAAVLVTPGMKSPTIQTLEDKDYKAISCLVEKKLVSSKMDELHDLGASDILTFALTNTRM